MHEHDVTWARQSITDAIVSLQFLRNLKLIFPKTVSWQLNTDLLLVHLNQLSNLQKISIFGGGKSVIVDGVAEVIAKSPLLTHFEVNYHSWVLLPPPQYFFAKRSPMMPLHFSHVAVTGMEFCLDHRLLPHLRSLRSLELINIAPTNGIRLRPLADIYKTLAHEHIFLSHIVIDDVFPEFLDYLSLYSGTLVELSILYLCKPTPWEELDALAERFYGSVLPKHVESLELLKICPIFRCKWCFDLQDCSVLSQAKRLHSLNVSFPVSFPFTHSWPTLLDPDEYEYSLIDAVCDFFLLSETSYGQMSIIQVSFMIQLSLTLHFLTKIQINVAKPQVWRNPNYHHFPWHIHGEDMLIVLLNYFAYTIRLGISKLSHWSLPMIEVGAQFPCWYKGVPGRVSLQRKK
jgi:hypothetical protein